MAPGELCVVGVAGPLCVVQVGPSATVPDVKLAIEAQTGIRALEQRLFDGASELRSGALPLGGALPADADADGVAPQLLLVRRTAEHLQEIETARRDPSFLQSAPEATRGDIDVVLAGVSEEGHALQHAAEALRGEREVVEAAVTQNGTALAYASEALRADKAVVLAAIAHSRHGSALQFAAEALRADRGFVLEAVRLSNPGVLRYAAESLRADRTVREEAYFGQYAAM